MLWSLEQQRHIPSFVLRNRHIFNFQTCLFSDQTHSHDLYTALIPFFFYLCVLPFLSFPSFHYFFSPFPLSLARGPVERCLISCHRGKADDFWRIFSLRWSISQWHRHRCVLPQTSNQHQTCDVFKDSPYLFTVSYCDFQFQFLVYF